MFLIIHVYLRIVNVLIIHVYLRIVNVFDHPCIPSYCEKILRFEIYKHGIDDDDDENDYDTYGNNSEMRIIRQCSSTIVAATRIFSPSNSKRKLSPVLKEKFEN